MISGKMLIDCMTSYEKANRLYDKYTQAEIPRKKKKKSWNSNHHIWKVCVYACLWTSEIGYCISEHLNFP